jgi:large subunit ribosomal protein L23
MNPFSVLKRPLLSEKSNSLRENFGQYCFEVDRKATKHDIKKAVEMAFSVNVVSVKTNITRGHMKRRGMYYALAKSEKKAMVTLSQNQKLTLFEDQ